MATLTTARTALETAAALSFVERQRIDDSVVLKRIHGSLQELGSERRDRPVPASWLQWLARLNGDELWNGATTVAETGAREWSVDPLLRDPDAVQNFADLLLEDRPPWARTALLDSLPHFLSFLGRHGHDLRFRPVYDSLYALLATDPDISLPQVEALLNVVEARLTLGVTAAQYTECLAVLTDSFQLAATPAIASVALDAIEILVNTACPLPDQRRVFVGTAAALFQRWSRWIAPTQWLLLQELGGELDLSLVAPQEVTVELSEKDEWAELSGKKICLYSLNEAALHRAAAIIARLSPDSRTQAFHDLAGGSNALKAAARTADIFVIATGSATHAATIFIDSNRPANAITLRTRGKGSSSFLEVLQRHLRENAA